MTKRKSKRYRPPAPPELAKDAHKGDAGRVLGFVGSRLYPGAATLFARAAQRAGAGLVTLGCLDECLLASVPITAPEAVYLDLFGPADVERAHVAELLAARGEHALVVGCGLGGGERARALVASVLSSGAELPLVVDADGLNALGAEPERLRAYAGPIVITPHPGEASRLLGRVVPKHDEERAKAARELAQKSGAIVCLKGHRTVVTDGRTLYVNDSGNPGMATAGAGDVLAGILGAYLAACVTCRTTTWKPFDAAASAVHVHGAAGDLAAKELGRRGLVASDLIAFLPAAQRRLRS
ncbi:MAG: NAD(P)H-hydrate dehydratase [Planctomycetes bacterium]|nr:NAD(P)H-hydrate dehydratase [Planctomycetota bacterium]